MTKADLIEKIADKANLTKAAAERVLNAFLETVLVAVGAGQTQAKHAFHERSGNAALNVEEIVIAIGRVGESLKLVEIGLGRLDVERSCRGVAPEQRPLGTTQQFNLRHIQQVTQRNPRTAQVNAIQKNAHGAFQPRVVAGRAHAADPQRRATAFCL